MNSLKQFDPEISRILLQENRRQNETIDLIASENYPSQAVYEAQNSVLISKYAEGYPGKRYYGGCQNADAVERLAIERVKELFHSEHANVQSHAGSQANMTAYFALLDHGDTVMSMKHTDGGHLTHGDKVNFSGKSYNFIRYGVERETERIDYPRLEALAMKHRPRLIVAGASAYPRIIDFERFRHICDRVGAKLMVDMAHTAGMIAAGLHPSPLPYADVVTSTTHKTLRGPRGGFILCRSELAPAIDAAVCPGTQGGPFMHTIAAKAVTFYEAMQPEFVEYQRNTLDNALTLANELKELGMRLVSGGTDTHLLLIDLAGLGINGKKAEEALGRAGLVANRDGIPFDTRSSLFTSGIRLGTPAVTTRGFGQAEMKRIAAMVVSILKNPDDPETEKEVGQEVSQLCSRFPVPGIDN